MVVRFVAESVRAAAMMAAAARRFLIGGLLLPAAFLASGCMTAFVPEHQQTPPAPASLAVEVSGTPGLGFEGSLGTVPASRSVEGRVPTRYTVETAVAVAVNLRKASEDGELTVRILRGDEEVARQTTIAPYGSVLVVYRVTR